jgi:hypothetical protein
MTSRDGSDWRNWWSFFGRRVREFVFLAAWVCMAWALEAYIVRSFPVSGPPKYMLLAFEGLFDISTLFELVLLLFSPNQGISLRRSR